MKHYDLIGLGVGPFHLSLAALSQKIKNFDVLFLEKKTEFSWHPELMFEDAEMQTSCLKDLVTSVDPTSSYSFMNYLVDNGLYYSFMNTGRLVITRKEFEVYCKWAASKLQKDIIFNQNVRSVEFVDSQFKITTDKDQFSATHISIATGHVPRYPSFVNKEDLSQNYFHAKDKGLTELNLKDKKVVIIGGGQTGLEIFTYALEGKWGLPQSVRLVSKRSNLTPLDESNFTNEYFTPSYVNAFFDIDRERKDKIVNEQKFASDGNTPGHLRELYRTLYLNTLHGRGPDFNILPMRECLDVQKYEQGYKVTLSNHFINDCETLYADVVILATGLKPQIPQFLEPILHLIHRDECNRFNINKNFSVSWDGPSKNKIYALNFSRHGHGIAEPQTSLMAWRSATILNDLCQYPHYKTDHSIRSFLHYTKVEE